MNPSEKKVFMLDAMALIYRGHFAFSKSPRITSKGMNTGAILGFTNTLLEIINKEKPSHICVAFDTHAPTFRHIQYKEYKAQRQSQPEDITTAIPWIEKILKAFEIPILKLDGYEADDIIGTFAKKMSKDGFDVFMVTSDKDYAQLVEEHIFLYRPASFGTGFDILGVAEVLKKFEIDTTDQVRDILGLQGDNVDNIPGIPSIGEKTAVKLLKEYMSLENIIANAPSIKGKLGENIANYAEQGKLSKELATIFLEVPLEFDIKNAFYTGGDKAEIKKLFTELEFRTLSKRLFGEEPKINKEVPQLFEREIQTIPQESESSSTETEPKKNASSVVHDYHLIQTDEEIQSLLSFLQIQTEFCFDTETTSADAFEADLVGISFCWYPTEAYYIPISANQTEALKTVQQFYSIFANERIAKIGQNIKYDMIVLKKYGIEIKGKLFDTMIAHYLLSPDTKHNMDALAEHYLNYSPISIETLIGKKGLNQGNMRDVNKEAIKEYAAEDADVTFQLKEKIEKESSFHEIKKLLEETEIPLMEVLAEMEFTGVKIDTDFLNQMSLDIAKESQIVEQEIYTIAGERFNISSPQQLGKILFDKLKIGDVPKKTKTGQYATGEEIISKLAHKHIIIHKILEYREYQKLKSTYVDALPTMVSNRDGRVHTDYRQTIAATGRLSSNNPNLQNIPIRTDKGKEIRKAFIPRDENYKILSADYSQIELRIIAAFAKDESMIEAFKNGRDIHTTTASKIFHIPIEKVDNQKRRIAKSANFGIIYGISAFGLSENLNISRTEAKEIIDSYFREFPGVKKYMDESINKARETEYVTTILGRKRFLRDINSRNLTQRGFAERNAINTPIQGSAADLIKKAMITIHQWLQKEKLQTKMILQVHDELVFDAHTDELEMLKIQIPAMMQNAIDIGVPIEVSMGIGNNWLEAH